MWAISVFGMPPTLANHGQDHWSHLDGDGQVIWADSQLNEDGIEQAKALGRFWSDAVTNEKVPIPGTIYTSPLTRCLETTRLVFAKTIEGQGVQFRPIVKELLRERLTDHTCDRRSSRSWIEEHYPDYVIESGFSEEDRLWTGGRWESVEEHMARKHRVLEEIFATDENAFVALTVHSYAISAILGAIGTTVFRVREGNSIALLVKAERIDSHS
jgi:broad specificity phosphatase PhoE